MSCLGALFCVVSDARNAMSERFDGGRDGICRSTMHQDAHEFLNYLLNQIMEEMEEMGREEERKRAEGKEKSGSGEDCTSPIHISARYSLTDKRVNVNNSIDLRSVPRLKHAPPTKPHPLLPPPHALPHALSLRLPLPLLLPIFSPLILPRYDPRPPPLRRHTHLRNQMLDLRDRLSPRRILPGSVY